MVIIRCVVVLAFLFSGSMAAAVDLGGLGEKADTMKQSAKKARTASDAAAETLTKKLKKVQNEKGPIRFKKGKADVDPACDRTMKQIAKILKETPGFHVQVDGHTDNVGDPESNRKLSQARAEAVVKYLVKKKGADAKRLSAKGWGDTQAIADNKTAKGRAKNRRVDFTVTRM
jgi:outer membrane protein OmpA-like peptidoglycan-associated protein